MALTHQFEKRKFTWRLRTNSNTKIVAKLEPFLNLFFWAPAVTHSIKNDNYEAEMTFIGGEEFNKHAENSISTISTVGLSGGVGLSVCVGLSEQVGLRKGPLLYLLVFLCRLYRVSLHVFCLGTSLKTD